MSSFSVNATDRVRTLLEPGHDEFGSGAGYLDLLGADRVPQRGAAQRLMTSRLIPLVYERWWRPAVRRLTKGPAGPSLAEEQRWAGQQLALAEGHVVLDLACGPGNLTRELATAVGPSGLVVGLDVSATMLTMAGRHTGSTNISYLRTDAVRPPLRNETFDAICCFAALHLFDAPLIALDGMTRLLKPEGRVAILTSCLHASAPRRAVEIAFGSVSGMRMFERTELTSALAVRGFVDIKQTISGMTQFVGARRPGRN